MPTRDRAAALDGAARCMRALTGYDRVILAVGADRVESSRGKLPALSVTGELPQIVSDTAKDGVAIFPHDRGEDIDRALLRAATSEQLQALRAAGVGSVLRVPIIRNGEEIGSFQCDSRVAQPPSFEQHAAAELFAQMFGLLIPG